MAWFFQTEYKNSDLGTYFSPDIDRIPEEHERFKAMGSALYRELDAHWTARRLAEGLERKGPEVPRLGPSRIPKLIEGWRWPIPDEPFRDQLKRPEEEMVGIVGSSFGTYAISQKVIDIIENIEPGVHQYLPYEMINLDGSVHPAKRWLLNVCTRLELVDIERSNVVEVKDVDTFGLVAGKPRKLIVDAKRVMGRAIWCEYRCTGTPSKTLISDQFFDALQVAEIRGWEPHYSFREHIEEL